MQFYPAESYISYSEKIHRDTEEETQKTLWEKILSLIFEVRQSTRHIQYVQYMHTVRTNVYTLAILCSSSTVHRQAGTVVGTASYMCYA